MWYFGLYSCFYSTVRGVSPSDYDMPLSLYQDMGGDKLNPNDSLAPRPRPQLVDSGARARENSERGVWLICGDMGMICSGNYSTSRYVRHYHMYLHLPPRSKNVTQAQDIHTSYTHSV